MKRTDITAAMVVIGNEILSGRTQDANINTLARRLTDCGIDLQEVRVIPDNEAMIVDTVNTLRAAHTYVFTTGGIGPTHDDITVSSIAKAFGVAVVRHTAVESMLKNRPNAATNTEATFKMADYPAGAELLPTEENIPPGCYLGNVFMLAGVPRIMADMLESAVPLLEQGQRFFSQTVDAMLPESKISAPLSAVQDMFPQVEIGSYPFKSGNTYGTSLVVRGRDEHVVSTAFGEVEKFVRALGL